MAEIRIIKKDGSLQEWEPEKIRVAINKSATRAGEKLDADDEESVISFVLSKIQASGNTEIPVGIIHNYVERGLRQVNEAAAASYRDYRNWKKRTADMMDEVWQSEQRVRFLGDQENANKDSALVATQQALRRSAISKEFAKMLFKKEWVRAHNQSFIYIHDMSDRIDTMNCCLFRIGTLLKGGFNMANTFYTEPKTLAVAFHVTGDIVLSAAAQQYGGFTIPQVDKILDPYAEKTYQKAKLTFLEILGKNIDELTREEEERMDAFAEKQVYTEMKQGWQEFEMKFNTVGSSRGDYPFITVTFGLSTSRWGRLCQMTALQVHAKGQGEKGKEKPVLFPKYVFLYDEKLHGAGAPCEDVFMQAVECSKKTMYPDYLSMSGEGYISNTYKKYGEAISPMGCRAFLSPYWEIGGQTQADEFDHPIYEGRFNIGVVSLNLPLIYLSAKKENKDFYEVLDYYLQMIREIHQYTYEFLGERPASINPLAFCEGGFYLPSEDGRIGLNPDEKIAPFLDAATASFGITALNELQQAYNHKSIVEDGNFALEVMHHITDKVNEFKEADHHLYAIYGTPAESLCGKQADALKQMFGIIPGVSDKDYVSNSFHCGVWEDITGPEKQDLEGRFWELLNGGKIQYCRYPLSYNTKSFVTLIRRAMAKGFYEGCNLSLNYCNDCGHEWNEDSDTCPCCGSKNLTSINRMNGYLAYSRVSVKQADGSYRTYSRLNKAKMVEISERKSM